MSRAGRKRETAYREPNGRIVRPTMHQLAELERANREIEKVVVLAQPHRRGDTDQLRESALGRFILDHKLRRTFFDVGNEYAALVRRLRAVKGVPIEQNASGGGMGIGPSDATVRGWERKEEGLRTTLMRIGTQAYLNLRRLSVEDRDIKPEFDREVITGLVAIGAEMGITKANDHPFLTGHANQ